MTFQSAEVPPFCKGDPARECRNSSLCQQQLQLPQQYKLTSGHSPLYTLAAAATHVPHCPSCGWGSAGRHVREWWGRGCLLYSICGALGLECHDGSTPALSLPGVVPISPLPMLPAVDLGSGSPAATHPRAAVSEAGGGQWGRDEHRCCHSQLQCSLRATGWNCFPHCTCTACNQQLRLLQPPSSSSVPREWGWGQISAVY